MNTPVNFELAKLLKEKGFDTIDCNGYYHICNGYTKGYAHCYSDVNTQKEDAILAPTIAEVVMWLYEKHGIWISVDRHHHKFKSKKDGVLIDFDGKTQSYSHSPVEAYEAAIEYTLKNLIKIVKEKNL